MILKNMQVYIPSLQLIAPVTLIDFKNEVVEVDITKGQGDASEYAFNEVTFMSSTGVVDDNNNEIYEGYVVTVHHTLIENMPSYRAVVEWDKTRFALYNLESQKAIDSPYVGVKYGLAPYQTLDSFGVSLKIIGNIYEHPELVEGY